MDERLQRVARYLSTGGVGLCVNLGSFAWLVHTGMPYLGGSIIALSCSTVVGFVLQKYWTFAERTHERAPRQFFLYVGLALWNVMLNTVIVYITVEFVHAHYLFAQACGAGFVALSSFFVYRYYIFKLHPAPYNDTSGTPRQS